MAKKILFVVHHRKDRSPGQRFRCEEFLPALEAAGYEIDYSILLDADDDKEFYKPANYFGKLKVLLKATYRRIKNVINKNDYDIIFLYREAHMLGTIFFEKQLAKSRAKLIFDFDDSIWVDNVSEGNKMFSFLKNADKTKDIIKLCDIVFAGNDYLANYAKQFNKNVVIVPTTIDTNEYQKVAVSKSEKVCIGWSGSITTIQHFNYAIDALKIIKEKYKDQVYIKVIGDGNYVNKELDIKGLPWKKDTELKDLSEFDIGLMPLPDDEWAKGKCGLKGLQYMSLGIATIMSPVGVNKDIIQDGKNGYLASTTEEWVVKISQLIDDAQLRKALGDGGKKTIDEQYSVYAWKDKYVNLYNQLIK